MVLSITFSQEHPIDWYTGYKFNCKKPHLNIGPKNGVPIKINNLPVSGSNNYLQFWAAKHNNNDSNWNSIGDAYDESSFTETQPSFDYFNSGFVEINKNGSANFRLQLPSGYTNNSGETEHPHIHFRICSNNYMSHVYTLAIPKTDIDSSLKVIN